MALTSPCRFVFAFVLFLSFIFAGVVDAQAPTPLASAHPFGCWGAFPTPLPTNSFTQLALGNFHVCGLTAAHAAECWGQNGQGQQNASTSGLEFAWLSAGFTVSCGLLSADNTARCYGTNADNRTAVPTDAPYNALAMLTDFGCALSSDGVITCWGKNDQFQASSRPSGDGFTQVATGYAHGCALNASAQAQCWGRATGGATAPPAETFRSLCAGSDFTCGLTLSDGFPRCWGTAAYIAGTPDTTPFDYIACGATHVCGLHVADGTVQCWGAGTTDAKTPPAGLQFAQIYGGNDYTCGLYVPSPPPQPSTTPTPLSSPTSGPFLSTTPNPSASFTPVRSATPSVTPSRSAAPSASASASASRYPSPTAMPVVSPLAANASASFGDSEPTVDLSAPAAASANASSSVAVRSSLQLVQLGNTTVPGITWAASNGSGSGAGRRYEAQLDADTNATQEFAFSANASSASFSGLEFVIAAGSIKWSLNFTAATSGAAAAQGVTLRYRLSDLSNASAAGSPGRLAVVRRADNTPRANMTSYYLAVPSAATSSVVMVVEVFDVALVDDAAFVPVAHAVDVANDSAGDHYELVLAFPAFNRSLFYDPSIGLGVLLGSSGGRDGDGGSGGGGDDVGLIVGVVVAVGVAAVVVVAVIVAGLALALWRKRRHLHSSGVVNFDKADQSGL